MEADLNRFASFSSSLPVGPSQSLKWSGSIGSSHTALVAGPWTSPADHSLRTWCICYVYCSGVFLPKSLMPRRRAPSMQGPAQSLKRLSEFWHDKVSTSSARQQRAQCHDLISVVYSTFASTNVRCGRIPSSAGLEASTLSFSLYLSLEPNGISHLHSFDTHLHHATPSTVMVGQPGRCRGVDLVIICRK